MEGLVKARRWGAARLAAVTLVALATSAAATGELDSAGAVAAADTQVVGPHRKLLGSHYEITHTFIL